MKKRKSRVIPAMPNMFPYNELLLQGKLSAKTRNWCWGHTGLTLLYTSTRTSFEVAKAHGLDPKTAERRVLVGVGELIPVRELTFLEAREIEKEFANGRSVRLVYAGNYRYAFKNLKRFKKPVSFRPPRGAVRTFNVPYKVVAGALREIGVSF